VALSIITQQVGSSRNNLLTSTRHVTIRLCAGASCSTGV